jgi:hypothetical protein
VKGQRRQNGWVSPFDWRQQGGNGRNSGSCGPQPASKTAFARLWILLELRRKGVYTSYTRDFIELFDELSVETRVYDPHVKQFPHELFGLEQAVRGADAIVVTCAHSEFKYLDPAELKKQMRGLKVFDFCNLLEREKWEASGFDYFGRGRTGA